MIVDCFIDWFIDWLIDWVFDLLIVWLIDWLTLLTCQENYLALVRKLVTLHKNTIDYNIIIIQNITRVILYDEDDNSDDDDDKNLFGFRNIKPMVWSCDSWPWLWKCLLHSENILICPASWWCHGLFM